MIYIASLKKEALSALHSTAQHSAAEHGTVETEEKRWMQKAMHACMHAASALGGTVGRRQI